MQWDGAVDSGTAGGIVGLSSLYDGWDYPGEIILSAIPVYVLSNTILLKFLVGRIE